MKKMEMSEVCARLNSNGFELVDSEYRGQNQKHSLKCLKCGFVFERKISHIFGDNNTCPKCTGRFRSINEDITIERLAKKGITSLSPIINAKRKQRFLCDKGHRFTSSVAYLISNKTKKGCPYCSGMKQHTTKSIKKILKESGIDLELLDEYVNRKSYNTFRCQICGSIFKKRAGDVLDKVKSGVPGCAKCALSKNGSYKKITQADFIRRMSAKSIDVLDRYTGYNKTNRFRCKICGYKFSEKALRVLRRENACKKCFEKKLGKWNKLSGKIVAERLKKKNITLLGKLVSCSKKTRMMCDICGHKFVQRPSDVFNYIGYGCPKCLYKSQRMAGDMLEKHFHNWVVRRNVYFGVYRRFADFILENGDQKIWVEYDGRQHFFPVKLFGGEKRFKTQQQKDEYDKVISEKLGIPLFRIRYDENIEEAVSNIRKLF